MVKEILSEPGRTFGEYSLLPGHTPSDVRISTIDLETDLSGVVLKVPFLSAAMMSVTGYDMALALGQEGGLGVLPVRLTVEEQADIVRRIKSYKMGFVDDPITVRSNFTVEQVLKIVDTYGHSKIPVVDRNNRFMGMFTQQHYWDTSPGLQEIVSSAMIPFAGGTDIPCCKDPDVSVNEIRELLKQNGGNYIVVLDDQDRLVKLAFRKDVETPKVASAITTHRGWQERVKQNIDAGVDMFVIDTSDADTDFLEAVIREYKSSEGPLPPLCAGNVVTGEAVNFLIDCGADIVKIGMSSGSTCTTQREKAVGRAPMTALIESDKARLGYFKKTGIYIPLIVDGGVTSSADMLIALTMADAIMMGNYFNRFIEAEGEKFDRDGKPTNLEDQIAEVATWGEASARGRNLDRYGHSTMRTFFEEGVEGRVCYAGRLKAVLKKDIMKIKGGMVNVGTNTLSEFRKRAVIELNSPHTTLIVGSPHDIKIGR